MKFSGPLESQRLSLLLETAISREAQMWKAHVPKIQPNQVMFLLHIFHLYSKGMRLSSGLVFCEQLKLLHEKIPSAETWEISL